MSEVYAEKFEQVVGEGHNELELNCDVYYALVLQRKSSASVMWIFLKQCCPFLLVITRSTCKQPSLDGHAIH